jgi:hypothetical protein
MFFHLYLLFNQSKKENIKKTNVAFKALHMVTIKGIHVVHNNKIHAKDLKLNTTQTWLAYVFSH